MQKSFIFNVHKCTGCEACQIACSIENRVDPRVSWRKVYKFNPRRYPGVASFNISMACNHCVDPPCVRHCPALAFSKDPETGAVTIDAGKCIGCKYCSWACPFDVPQYDPASGVVEKCTMCGHRIEAGMEPACVALCPTRALRFGDFEDDGARTPGLTPTRFGPAILFVTRPLLTKAPVCSAADRGNSPPGALDEPAARITLRAEWTLMVFSFFAALLVGAFASTLAGASTTPGSALTGRPLLFALVGVAALALSTLHLGRRRRVWRAVLNWRRSWLSREVLLFPVFLALATAVLATGGSDGAAGWIVAAVGFAALVAVDRVYDVTGTPGLSSHSAQVLLTGLLYTGLFSANVSLFGLAAVAKTVLYLGRKYQLFRQQRDYRPWTTRARVLVGLAVPLLVWWKAFPAGYPAVVAGAVAGELIDRCEFYLEMDAPSPRKQMDADLRAHLEKRDGIAQTNL